MSEFEPQNEEEDTFEVRIQQVKHALKTFKEFN